MSNEEQLKVFPSSTGLGLKALRSFEVAEHLIEYTGQRISNEETYGIDNRYLFHLNDKYCLDGSSISNLARYINHSCCPNSQALLSHDEQRVTIEAIKPIEKDEEILIDYGEEYFNEYILPDGCRCAKCRT
jgi:SET domain-containing protein